MKTNGLHGVMSGSYELYHCGMEQNKSLRCERIPGFWSGIFFAWLFIRITLVSKNVLALEESSATPVQSLRKDGKPVPVPLT